MKKLSTDIESKALRGKRVIVRASLNVPTKDGVVVGDFRIKKALPTLQLLVNAGAKVIVVAHVGREAGLSLAPIALELRKYIPVTLVPDTIGVTAQNAVADMKEGDMILLENIRRDMGEIENDDKFSAGLAALGDMYINDAFPVSHRKHASIIGVPKLLPSYIGLAFEDELEHLTKALHPDHPALFVLGGAKFNTKEPLIKKFLDTYDSVFVCGALANDFFKAQGHEIGESFFSDALPSAALLAHPHLVLPTTVVVENSDGERATKRIGSVQPDESIMDNKVPEGLVTGRKFILWNGPLGKYEEGYSEGTIDMARAVALSSATSIIGGGDTVAAIGQQRLEKQISFLSTAGGAMLTYLVDGTLPGIAALT